MPPELDEPVRADQENDPADYIPDPDLEEQADAAEDAYQRYCLRGGMDPSDTPTPAAYWFDGGAG